MTLASQVGFVALAAVIGAIAYPMFIFVAIKLNWKQLGRILANHRQDARFYRGWSLLGAALGTLMFTGILILDAYGIKDPWYGLTLIALCMLAFYPMIGFLKQGGGHDAAEMPAGSRGHRRAGPGRPWPSSGRPRPRRPARCPSLHPR